MTFNIPIPEWVMQPYTLYVTVFYMSSIPTSQWIFYTYLVSIEEHTMDSFVIMLFGMLIVILYLNNVTASGYVVFHNEFIDSIVDFHSQPLRATVLDHYYHIYCICIHWGIRNRRSLPRNPYFILK